VAPVVIRRLSLEPPRLATLAVAVLGLVGVTTMLDSIVGLLDLRDFGTLASMRDAVAGLDAGQKLVFAVLIGIGPGVTEELFFRGYFLNRLAAARGTAGALVASSLLFGAFHADPVHSVLAAVMGLYLGACLVYSRSLWVPIAAHTANNAMATLTADWIASDLQAILLIPLGGIAGVSAVVLLGREGRALPRPASVW
jgi:membrane protease YdiL (CAAX protease family)